MRSVLNQFSVHGTSTLLAVAAPDNGTGTLGSSMHAGVSAGAIDWETRSDIMGRNASFNGALSHTFGILASFASSL